MTLLDTPTTTHELETRGLSLGYGDRLVVQDLSLPVPTGRVSVVDRRERLRQVDAAARAGPAAAAGLGRRCCSTAATCTGCPAATSPRCSASCRRRRPRRRASPSPTSSAAAGTRTRAGSAPGRRPTTRAVTEALRSPTPLELAERPVDELRGGQRQRVWIAMALAQQHRPAAARRAHHLPGPHPPGRGARPAHRPQPPERHHRGDRAARPQPGLPLRRPPGGDEGRPRRRRRTARRRSSPPRRSPRSSGCTARVIDDPVSHTPTVIPVGRHHCG